MKPSGVVQFYHDQYRVAAIHALLLFEYSFNFCSFVAVHGDGDDVQVSCTALISTIIYSQLYDQFYTEL
jgi:hypothetical protein